MSPRYDIDFSMWPERARPRRSMLAAGTIGTAFILSIAGVIAAGNVLLQLADPLPSGAPKQTSLIEEPFATPDVQPAEGRSAASGSPAATALGCSGGSSVRPCVDTATSGTPRGRSAAAARVVLPAIGRAGPKLETDGRGTPSPQSAEQRAAQTPPAAIGQLAAQSPPEAAVPEEAKPTASERPKPRAKKARKRHERPATATVYELPDGRRITIYRRQDSAYAQGGERQASPYQSYAPPSYPYRW